jgi:hypothetical protein
MPKINRNDTVTIQNVFKQENENSKAELNRCGQCVKGNSFSVFQVLKNSRK